MSFVKKVVFTALMIFSLNAFSQDYEYPVLKAGVKNDIENLIANQNNFVDGTTGKGVETFKAQIKMEVKILTSIF